MPLPDPKKQPNKFIQFSTIALQMGLTIYLGNLLGIWLDKKFELTYLENTVTLSSILLSMYLVISQVIKASK